MGDRGNIAVIGRDSRDQVWFYGHWSGYRMPAVLQQAVREGKGRWQDPSYFARVVFCRLLPPDDRYEETSYGISTGIGDNEHPIMVADCVKQQVYTIAEKQLKNGQVPADYKPKEAWSFEEYSNLEKLPWGSMESQLNETTTSRPLFKPYMKRLHIVTWDWKDQPNWDAINTVLSEVQNPCIVLVETTTDDYAAVIGSFPLTKQEAQQWFDHHKWEADEL